ncbi:PREDICTED: copine-7 isoform X7 [Hipposideros armiger]|uniref:Copine-7 isoform X7 n=1 Tax=Hipposideros armiger TaxID=186990 RepID=A0A8B7RAS5_HIPAR|nr:PREDICTED: copine-7 isoform X7 [Hipposideros armiger]
MSAGSERGASAAPGVVPAPCASKVELRLSCRHLLDRDPLTKSDPSVLLLLRLQGQWVQVGRTEVVPSCLHPTFSKVFTLDYYFEEVQKLRFEVYDSHGPSSHSCQDDDFLGGMECTLGQIVAQKKMTQALLLKFGRNAGKSTITVIAEDISANNGYVELSFRARKLDDKDLFSKSDPFLEMYRVNDDQSEQLVYRTEVVKNNLSPAWEPFKVSLNCLCSCEETRPLKGLVWDHDSRGKHDLIGEFATTFAEMQKAFREGQAQWDCMNTKYKQKKRNYKNSGVVILADLKALLTLLPGSSTGCTLSWTTSWAAARSTARWPSTSQPPTVTPGTAAPCITSTPSNPTSTCRPWWRWARSARTTTVTRGSLLWGLEPGSLPSLRCPMTLPSTSTPRTMSAKVARMAAAEERTAEASQYYILLILTDGVVTDMADTREAIVRASHLPMSVIIVGVGNADFTDMQTLDGDAGVLCSPRGEPAARDIVQFVPFRELKNASPAALAKCVLAEVPKQLVEYYSHKELPPRGLSAHARDGGPGCVPCGRPERAGQLGEHPISSAPGVP